METLKLLEFFTNGSWKKLNKYSLQRIRAECKDKDVVAYLSKNDARDLGWYGKMTQYKKIYCPISRSNTGSFYFLPIYIPVSEFWKWFWITETEYRDWFKRDKDFTEYLQFIRDLEKSKHKKKIEDRRLDKAIKKVSKKETYKKVVALTREMEKLHKERDKINEKILALNMRRSRLSFYAVEDDIEQKRDRDIRVEKENVMWPWWTKVKTTVYIKGKMWRPRKIEVTDENKEEIKVLLDTIDKDERERIIHTIQRNQSKGIR